MKTGDFDHQRHSQSSLPYRDEPQIERMKAMLHQLAGRFGLCHDVRFDQLACLAPHLMQAVKLAAASGNPNDAFDYLAIAGTPEGEALERQDAARREGAGS